MAPLGRQPQCGHCEHEEHIYFACEWCGCEAHRPNGEKDEDEHRALWLL